MILKNVLIDKIIFKGFGLGTYQGKKVFVPFSYPGDIVDVEVISEKKDYYKALPVNLNESKIKRIPVTCPVFTQCGGCNMLDLAYPEQCDLKRQVLEDIFPDYTQLISPTQPSPKHYSYRNKVFFPVHKVADKIAFGMFKNLSHTVISASDCLLISPQILAIAQEICDHFNEVKEEVYEERTKKGNIRHLGFRLNSQNQVMVIIVTNKSKLAFTKTLVQRLTDKFPNIISVIQNINKADSNRIMGETDKLLFGEPYFLDTIKNKQYKLHYQSFFQINREMAELIYEQIKADIAPQSVVLDAYSGVSTIGIYVADSVKQVISVESNKWATDDAKFNITLNKSSNITVINAKLEEVFAGLIHKHQITSIVFDPPRKGLEPKIRELIATSNLQQIIYLSCNPTTQKRDIQDFIKAGFTISKIIPFDMFPNTYHIESYVLLQRI
ncbi:MAG: 23S rRNA (uracil(1939)-C(5))-methyltransferase RlmD [Candidatus Cloacimonadales bacterium]